MLEKLERMPIHTLLFAAYSVLALYARNITEVSGQVIIRPLLVSVTAAIAILLTTYIFQKDWQAAAIASSLILILIFSYGHLYQFLEQTPLLGVNFGRHRLLTPVYGVFLGLGLWLTQTKLKHLGPANRMLNISALVLLIFPLFTITDHWERVSTGIRKSAEQISGSNVLSGKISDDSPDIYYIILDSYSRADVLHSDFQFDNSAFLEELQSMGFYVAECSRSNYRSTQGSLTSALNMAYLPELERELAALDLDSSELWILLKQSAVRKQLESIGYETVAFDSGFEWSRMSDASVYLDPTRDPYRIQQLEPFEALWIQTTAGLILTDIEFRRFTTRNEGISSLIENVKFPYQDHTNRQLFILDQLPSIAAFQGPKFVFVHLLTPHIPHVFGPGGEILTDPGFYSGKHGAPINAEYTRKGYTGEIQFINQQMVEISKTIISNSDRPPIIIIQGDHGVNKANRFPILNAYYLPNDGGANLYPTVSPVNTFRIIFDLYFGTDYGLLPDQSFSEAEPSRPVPEGSPECSFSTRNSSS